MPTGTSLDVAKLVRARLLGFVPTGSLATGGTLASRLTNRLSIDRAPKDVSQPYAVLTVDLLGGGGTDGGTRQAGEIVLLVYFPDEATGAQTTLVWDAGDVAVQALTNWAAIENGRTVLKVTGTPMARTVRVPGFVVRRVSVPFYAYPDFLTGSTT